MVTFEIKENRIHIKFDTCPDICIRNKMKSVGYKWNAYKKTWYAPHNTETSLVASELCPDYISMMEQEITDNNATNNFNENESRKDRNIVGHKHENSELSLQSIDELINEIKTIEEDNKVLNEKSKAYEDSLKAYQDLKAKIKNNNEQIESISVKIKDYLESQDIKRHVGTDFNASLKDCSPIIEFDSSIIDDLLEKIHQNVDLPDWLILNIKIDRRRVLKNMKETGEIPIGINVSHNTKVVIWDTMSDDPTIRSWENSLHYFEQGYTIDEIATKRGLAQTTILGHLGEAIRLGKLKIEDKISQSDIALIKNLISTNKNSTCFEVYNMLNKQIRKDYIYLIFYTTGMNVDIF